MVGIEPTPATRVTRFTGWSASIAVYTPIFISVDTEEWLWVSRPFAKTTP